MAKQPNLFPLKLLVISLGVVLIGGTICLFGAIAGKAGKALGSPACTDKTINLHGHKMTNVSLQGDKLYMTLSDDSSTKLLTLDRCSGKTLQTITIAP